MPRHELPRAELMLCSHPGLATLCTPKPLHPLPAPTSTPPMPLQSQVKAETHMPDARGSLASLLAGPGGWHACRLARVQRRRGQAGAAGAQAACHRAGGGDYSSWNSSVIMCEARSHTICWHFSPSCPQTAGGYAPLPADRDGQGGNPMVSCNGPKPAQPRGGGSRAGPEQGDPGPVPEAGTVP